MTSITFSQPTRERILAGVCQLLSQGKAHLPMSQIALQAGISKSALYYFFPSKKALCEAVILSIFSRLVADLEHIAQESTPAPQKIRRLIATCIDRARKESTLTNFIFRQVFENDATALAEIFALREKSMAVFEKVISEGQRAKEFTTTDAKKTAAVLLGLIDFSALTAAFPEADLKHTIATPELFEHFLTLLERF